MNNDQPTSEKYSPAQKALALQINAYLQSQLGEKVTILQLADHFDCSPTTVKTAYRNFYGTSIYAAFKSMKMHAAAEDLASSDLSVISIAAKYGYINCSKFSDAFRKVMGILPGRYRRAALKAERPGDRSE